MLNQTDKERLATLEADIPWIKDALGRLELGQKELHKSHEKHLAHHRGDGSINGNGGVKIIIGKRALGLLASVPVGGTVAGVLRSLGVL